VVEHGRTGLLVDAGDATQLRAALAQLAADPTLGARLGGAARAFVRPRFGADRYVDQVARLYDSLLAAKGVA
jgi:glycosyltransferase involved in cell wall biosynthesis